MLKLKSHKILPQKFHQGKFAISVLIQNIAISILIQNVAISALIQK